MAPLTATLAAGVAVGVGIVLAKAAREREQDQRRERTRRLGLLPGEPPEQAFKRMTLGQVELALELLEQDGSPPSETAIHDTRKAIKRLRALLRLLDGELSSITFRRENAVLRKVAGRLAGARDAEVMLGTLDALIERHPRKLRRRKGVRKLRRELVRQRRRAARSTLDPSAVARAIAELRAFRARVQAWSLPAMSEAELIEGPLARLYRQGRKRHERAARLDGRDTEAMHDWRKRVKSLRYAAEMLERRVPEELKPKVRAKQLKALASRADDLGEVLGEDHDLAVLAELVRSGARGKHRSRRSRPGRRTRKLLLELIARRRRQLRKQALREGRRLYRPSPKRFVRALS